MPVLEVNIMLAQDVLATKILNVHLAEVLGVANGAKVVVVKYHVQDLLLPLVIFGVVLLQVAVTLVTIKKDVLGAQTQIHVLILLLLLVL